ncbi:MAG TPA: hypothetical protein VEO00_08670 [Actinomycetota bacterium]|nr:hypothetical protein [Actinomycetota bacterium]
MVDPVARRGYRFRRTAGVVDGGPLFDRVAAFYRDRGVAPTDEGGRRIKAAVLIRVEAVEPLISPGYDDGTEENAMRGRWFEIYRRVWLSEGD